VDKEGEGREEKRDGGEKGIRERDSTEEGREGKRGE